MWQFNILRDTKGWLYIWERTIRFRHMQNKEEVRRRAKALDVWREIGLDATVLAFDVSRPTLFRWKKVIAEREGHLEALGPKSTAPKERMRRNIPDAVKVDIVVRFVDGTKRYILAAIGMESRFAFAYAFTSHGSKPATEFLRAFKSVAPVTLTHVQTDNGSEFGAHFDCAFGEEGIVHFHTYPRSPKQNAEIKRFNRTLFDTFIRYHRSTLSHDLDGFNQKLMDWLLWYNIRRPHWGLGLVSPLRYVVSTLPDQLRSLKSAALVHMLALSRRLRYTPSTCLRTERTQLLRERIGRKGPRV